MIHRLFKKKMIYRLFLHLQKETSHLFWDLFLVKYQLIGLTVIETMATSTLNILNIYFKISYFNTFDVAVGQEESVIYLFFVTSFYILFDQPVNSLYCIHAFSRILEVFDSRIIWKTIKIKQSTNNIFQSDVTTQQSKEHL